MGTWWVEHPARFLATIAALEVVAMTVLHELRFFDWWLVHVVLP